MLAVGDFPRDGACPRSAAAFKQDGEGGEEAAAAGELVGDVELLDDDLAGAEQRDVGGSPFSGPPQLPMLSASIPTAEMP